jgi:hypothetical protein
MSESTVVRTQHYWGRWLAGGLMGLLVVGAAATPVIWAAIARHRLTVDLSQLRAAGEPVTPADLPVDDVADDRNASLDYKAAAALVDEDRPAWFRWYDLTRDGYTFPLAPAEADALRALVVDNGPALTRVAASRGKQIGTWHDGFAPPLLQAERQFDLNGSRSLANLINLAALSAHAGGDDAAAAAYLLDSCRLADAAERRPSCVAHLVAVGIWSVAANAVDRIGPELRVGSPGGASRAQVDELINRLTDERGAQAGARLAWATQRMAYLESLGGVAAAGSFHAYINAPVVLGDARLLTAYLSRLERAGSAVDWPAAQRQLPAELDAEVDEHPGWHPFTSIVLPALRRDTILDFRCLTERRLAAVGLAVRVWKLGHDGRLPPTLAALVPAYLAAGPADPMSGRLLLYRSTGPNPIVYSVGQNGRDDGGIETDYSRPLSQQGGTDDIVVRLARQSRPTRR